MQSFVVHAVVAAGGGHNCPTLLGGEMLKGDGGVAVLADLLERCAMDGEVVER